MIRWHKNLLIGLIVAVLLLSVGAATAQEALTTARITSPTGSADLLQAPTVNSHPIRSLPNDTEVLIIAVYRENWYRVRLADENLSGWVSAEFLTLDAPVVPSASSAYSQAILLIARAEISIARLDFDPALEYLNEALALDPTNIRAYEARGYIYMMQGDYRHAFEDLTNAIDGGSSDPYTFYNRGYIYEQLGQYSGAYNDFDRAVELSPNESFLLTARAGVSLRMGDLDAALQDANAALALNTDTAAYLECPPLARDHLLRDRKRSVSAKRLQLHHRA